MTRPVRVFYSYSHKDEALRNQLMAHLSPLRNQHLIEDWCDRRVLAGERWSEIISEKLDDAEIILLLLSANFFHSGYCNGIEMRRALERHEEGSAKVIPILLCDCLWEITPVQHLSIIPRDNKPVKRYNNNMNKAFKEISQEIYDVVRAMRPESEQNLPSLAAELLSMPSGSSNRQIVRNKFFHDRASELIQLTDFFLKESKVSLLGPSGVGKTALVEEYIFRNMERYSVIWWFRGGKAARAATIAHLARELPLPEALSRDRRVVQDAVKRWLRKNSNWLLIFDDENPFSDGINDNLAEGEGHTIVVSRLGQMSAATIQLFPWSVDDSVIFLKKRLLSINDGDAIKIAEAVGGIPFALEQAAAYIEQENAA